jgi:hypothetical protein
MISGERVMLLKSVMKDVECDSKGQEKKIRPKEYTTGSGSKIWKNEMAIMWNLFPAKAQCSH